MFKRNSILVSTCFCFIFLSCYTVTYAADKILALLSEADSNTITVATNDSFIIKVRVDNDALVAGAAFTITYDTDNLSLDSINSTFFDTFTNQQIPTPNDQGYVTVESQDYYSPIVASEVIGTGVMIAAARVGEEPLPGSETVLFTLNFQAIGSSGTYPINIVPSVISNISAGYDENGEEIPMLVGIGDPVSYPSHNVTRNNCNVSITGFVDSDNDGISDDWEIFHFGNLTTATATSDFDRDGYTDLVEYQSDGTNDLAGNAYNPAVINVEGGIGYNPITDDTPSNVIGFKADFNGDGNGDILWFNPTDKSKTIWLMNGTSVLSQDTLTGPIQNLNIYAIADFDGDGNSDIMLVNPGNGKKYIWIMDGTTVFDSRSYSSSVEMEVETIADFNGDGASDILWKRTSDEYRYIWIMNGTTVTDSTSFTSMQNRELQAVGNFNGASDNNDDLLWSDTVTGYKYIWLMTGTSSTAKRYGSPRPWKAYETADFNGDSNVDIIWRNPTDGKTYIWLMNGTSVISGRSFTGGVVDLDLVGTTHFNKTSDSNADILWYNPITGAKYIWLMSGTTVASSLKYGGNNSYQVTGLADFDGDSNTDIMFMDSSNRNRLFWTMDGTTVVDSRTISGGIKDYDVLALVNFNHTSGSNTATDILWNHPTTGVKYIWLMDGVNTDASLKIDSESETTMSIIAPK